MRKIAAVAISLVLAMLPLRAMAAALAPDCSVAGFCQTPSGGDLTSSNKWETLGFVGLQGNFGTSTPELTFGVRRTETNTSNDVAGGKLDFSLPLDMKNLNLPTARLMGLYGNRDIQGEAGAGLQLKDFKPLIGLGAQVPFANFGANYVFHQGWEGYVGANSLRKPAKPTLTNSGELTCPEKYTLTLAAQNTKSNPEQFTKNGYFCKQDEILN